MGIDAAAEVFDSKRVSKDEFRSAGATIIKNEKLVVRIRGRYFPWTAAAPKKEYDGKGQRVLCWTLISMCPTCLM